jgi:hypothetical protein
LALFKSELKPIIYLKCKNAYYFNGKFWRNLDDAFKNFLEVCPNEVKGVRVRLAYPEEEQSWGKQEKYMGCPCLYTEPCSENCTCVSPWSSRGCARCTSYGSDEQKKSTAARLAKIIDGGAAKK